MRTDFGVERRPGGSKLDHGAVALDIQFAESCRQYLRSGARGGVIFGAAARECIHQPGPGDLRHEGVETHVGVERGLRETDNAKLATPRLRCGWVVKEDEPPGAER